MATLAVDAGGTRIKFGIVQNGEILARSSIEAHADEGLAPRLPVIAQELRRLIPTGIKIEGFGMAFPSLTKGEKVFSDVGKYRDADKIDLSAWAWSEFQVPFAIENDARMACIGEWQYGVAKGSNDVVTITLGTGIGTGVICEGRVFQGAHGGAGILGGHMTARIGGRQCFCGNVGCWETEASTASLPSMTNVQDCSGFTDYSAVFAEAELGNLCALKIRERSLEVWGALATSLVHAYDPEILVLSGGIMGSEKAILEPIRATVHRHVWPALGLVRVEASRLGNDAALLACEWLIHKRLEDGATKI